MTAYIGAQNLFESATTVTASNEASGFEGANAYDKRTSTWWKPGVSSPTTETLTAVFSTAQTVDFFGVMGHNLGTEGATIELQYLTGSPLTWTTLFSITPSDDTCIFRRTASAISATSWRVEITNCTASTLLAIAAFGEAVELPHAMKAPFMPTQYGRDKTISNIKTEGGQFIGRSVYSDGYEVDIMQSVIDPTWVSKFYDPLIDRAEVAPFFFCWDYQGKQSNLILYPEQLDNVEWIKRGICAVTANSTMAPDGTLSADLVENIGVTGVDDIYQPNVIIADGIRHEPSIWIYKVSGAAGGTLILGQPSGAGQYGRWYIDWDSIGGGWQRLTRDHPSVTVDVEFIGAPTNNAGIFIYKSSGTGHYDAYLWGAMLNLGTTSGPYLYTENAQTNNAAYCWLEKPTHPKYTHAGGLYMDFSWKCKGLIE